MGSGFGFEVVEVGFLKGSISEILIKKIKCALDKFKGV